MTLKPNIYVTVIAQTRPKHPTASRYKQSVLVQGSLLTPQSVQKFLKLVECKIYHRIKKWMKSSKSKGKTWTLIIKLPATIRLGLGFESLCWQLIFWTWADEIMCKLWQNIVSQINDIDIITVNPQRSSFMYPETSHTVKHDHGLVSILRAGLMALQLLPTNTTSGIVVITDGIVGSYHS